MLSVQCPNCPATSTMGLVGTKLFHFGSVKFGAVKHFTAAKHEPICLWCGTEFEPVKKALEKQSERPAEAMKDEG